MRGRRLKSWGSMCLAAGGLACPCPASANGDADARLLAVEQRDSGPIEPVAASPAAAAQRLPPGTQTTPAPRASSATSTLSSPAVGSGRASLSGDDHPAAAASPVVSEITVTGAVQAYRSTIGRKSYSLVNDLQTSTGSLTDVLRNIPSLDVDVQGNLSLRGDSNVTILVDGQPSALFQGPQRADALQQLPADRYERVEVLTNPSADLKPDGSGGIINLITRKTAGAARTATAKLNVGTGGRVNAGVNAGYNSKRVSLTGGLSVRHDLSDYEQSTARQVVDPLTGLPTPQRISGRQRGDTNSISGNGSLDYDFDARTRLSASVSGFESRFAQTATVAFRTDGEPTQAVADYDSGVSFRGDFHGVGGSATWLRRFSGEGHELSIRTSHNEVNGTFGGTFNYDYLEPADTTLFQRTMNSNSNASTDVKAEYKRPLAAGAKLVAGYELDVEDNSYDRRGLLGATSATATATAALNNLFDITQSVHAWYATVEKPLGRLTLLPGLRLEETMVDSDERTSGVLNQWDYFQVYPTLHVTYKINGLRTLSASFSRRVNRPDLQLLDPYLVYNGPLSYSQGNARLRPAITESYELGWEYRKGQTYRQANLFFRDNHDMPEGVSRDLGEGVLLTTQENIGSSRNLGLELVANGRLWKSLGYNISATATYTEIDPAGLAYTVARSGATARGRVSLSWDMTRNDFVQFNYNATGERLTAQGYTGASFLATLGYRHKFSDKLTLVATANDPFGQARSESVIETPQLRQKVTYRPDQRALYVGLTYAFGAPGRRQGAEAFDFGSGGATSTSP